MTEEIYPGDLWAQFGIQFLRFADTGIRGMGIAVLEIANEAWPLSQAKSIVDVGCGTGAAIKEIVRAFERGTFGSAPTHCKLLAFDSSSGCVDYLRSYQNEQRGTSKLWSSVQIEAWDATKLEGLQDDSFSHVVSSFGLYLMPKEAHAEAMRVLEPRGVLASSSFGRKAWIDPFRETLKHVRPDKTLPVPGPEWKGIDAVVRNLRDMGLVDCLAREETFYLPYGDAAEFVQWGLRTAPGLQTLAKELSGDEMERWIDLTTKYLQEHCKDNRLETSAIMAVGRKP